MSTRSTRYYSEDGAVHVFDDCFHDDVGIEVEVKPEDWSYEDGAVTLLISRATWDALVSREIELRDMRRHEREAEAWRQSVRDSKVQP